MAYEYLLMLSEVKHWLRINGRKKILIVGKGANTSSSQDKITSETGQRVHIVWDYWDLL